VSRFFFFHSPPNDGCPLFGFLFSAFLSESELISACIPYVGEKGIDMLIKGVAKIVPVVTACPASPDRRIEICLWSDYVVARLAVRTNP